MAKGNCLDKDIADCRALNGSGEYGAAREIRGQLVEQAVRTAPTDNVQRCERVSNDLFESVEGTGIRMGKTLENAAGDFPGR